MTTIITFITSPSSSPSLPSSISHYHRHHHYLHHYHHYQPHHPHRHQDHIHYPILISISIIIISLWKMESEAFEKLGNLPKVKLLVSWTRSFKSKYSALSTMLLSLSLKVWMVKIKDLKTMVALEFLYAKYLV